MSPISKDSKQELRHRIEVLKTRMNSVNRDLDVAERRYNKLKGIKQNIQDAINNIKDDISLG